MAALKPELQSRPSSSTMAGWSTKHHLTSLSSFPAQGQLHSHPGDAQGHWQCCETCSGTAGGAEVGLCRDDAPEGAKRKQSQKEHAAAYQKPHLYQHQEITQILKAHHNTGNFSAEIEPKRPLYSFLLCFWFCFNCIAIYLTVNWAPSITGTQKTEADNPPPVLYHFYWLQEYVLVKTQQNTAAGNTQPFLTNPIVQCMEHC